MLFVDCEDEAIFFQYEFILRYRSKSHTLNQIPHTGSFWKCLLTSSHRQLYYKYSKRKQKEHIRKYGHNKYLDVGFDFATLTAKHYEAQQLRK